MRTLTRPRPVGVGGDEVGEVEGGLAEEGGRALVLEDEEGALDGADRGGGDVAVGPGDVAGVVGEPGEDRLEVGEVEEEEALLVGDAEGDVEDALLGVGELHHPGEEQGAELADGGADGVAVLAEEVPEDDRGGAVGEVGEADLLRRAWSGRRGPWRRGRRGGRGRRRRP